MMFSNAQTPTPHCFLTCDKDLRSPIPSLLDISHIKSLEGTNARSYAKDNISSDYSDVQYKNEGDKSKPCVHSSQTENVICFDNSTASSTLIYNVYYPDKNYYDYTSCKPPALVLVHGGGFSDCSGINAPELIALAKQFSQRGFVVFLPEYRSGRQVDNHAGHASYTSASQLLAFYRAFQDIRGFVRTIIWTQQVGVDIDEFSFDTENIFIAGNSAGGVVAMNVAYYQSQNEINQIAPGCQTALGNIDIDYYKGGANIAYHDKIKGVLDMWGGAFIPLSAINNPYNFFSDNTSYPPAILFQGELDGVFDPQYQGVYFPTGTDKYKTETYCLLPNQQSFSLPDNFNITPYMYTVGTRKIYDFLIGAQPNSIPTELYIDCQMGHGLDDNCSTTGCYQSEFGTGRSTKADVYLYICERASTFFQAVLNQKINQLRYNTYTGTTKFIECENKRNGCSPSIQDNDQGCENTTDPCPTQN